MTGFSDEMTLREARDLLRTLVEDGQRCPCCTQFAKVYRRRVNSTNARLLIQAYRRQGRGAFHVPTVLGSHAGGEWARLAYWGLIKEDPTPREDGGRAGWWQVTTVGERFVLREAAVPKYARIYDGRCLGLVGEEVSISDALGTKFDYADLMAGL